MEYPPVLLHLVPSTWPFVAIQRKEGAERRESCVQGNSTHVVLCYLRGYSNLIFARLPALEKVTRRSKHPTLELLKQLQSFPDHPLPELIVSISSPPISSSSPRAEVIAYSREILFPLSLLFPSQGRTISVNTQASTDSKGRDEQSTRVIYMN